MVYTFLTVSTFYQVWVQDADWLLCKYLIIFQDSNYLKAFHLLFKWHLYFTVVTLMRKMFIPSFCVKSHLSPLSPTLSCHPCSNLGTPLLVNRCGRGLTSDLSLVDQLSLALLQNAEIFTCDISKMTVLAAPSGCVVLFIYLRSCLLARWRQSACWCLPSKVGSLRPCLDVNDALGEFRAEAVGAVILCLPV